MRKVIAIILVGTVVSCYRTDDQNTSPFCVEIEHTSSNDNLESIRQVSTYDWRFNKIEHVVYRGNMLRMTHRFQYDAFDNLTRKTSYNELNKLIEENVNSYENNLLIHTHNNSFFDHRKIEYDHYFEYNFQGLIIGEKRYVDGELNFERFNYKHDSKGNAIYYEESGIGTSYSSIREYRYNSRNDILYSHYKVLEEESVVFDQRIEYEYNNEGQRIHLRNYVDGEFRTGAFQYVYDSDGNKISAKNYELQAGDTVITNLHNYEYKCH